MDVNGFRVGLTVFLMAAAAASGATPATRQSPPSTIVRQPILGVKLGPAKAVASVNGVRIDFAPAQRTGLHLHPIPTVGYVTQGEIRFQVEGEQPKTLKAGDAFHEPANSRILLFDNASNRAPASFIVFYLMGAEDRDLIKMLQ